MIFAFHFRLSLYTKFIVLSKKKKKGDLGEAVNSLCSVSHVQVLQEPKLCVLHPQKNNKPENGDINLFHVRTLPESPKKKQTIGEAENGGMHAHEPNKLDEDVSNQIYRGQCQTSGINDKRLNF